MALIRSALLSIMIIAVGLHQVAEAVDHIVGGTKGWTIVSSDLKFFDTWAAAETFSIGDTLSFNYKAPAHDVVEVTAADLAACTVTEAISTNESSNAVVTLTTAGEHYFLCSVSGHCTFGMKFTVTVGKATAGAGPESSPPANTTSPPAPSSAAGLDSRQFLTNVIIGVLLAACAALNY